MKFYEILSNGLVIATIHADSVLDAVRRFKASHWEQGFYSARVCERTQTDTFDNAA